MTDTIIGIDLGTTNSEVAVVKNGKVIIIEDGGKKILPSVVGLADDDSILVGEAARNQYLLYPQRTVKSVKRLMGQDTEIDLAGVTYSPQEISAIILKRLKLVAEQYLQQPVGKAVITVPAYFSDAQRQATREASEIAGLEVVRMINEPTAAALAYDASHQQQKQMLVYDLGGGTFDVSVVNVEGGIVEVLSSHGNNHLGGDDFDAKIVGHILDHLYETNGFDVSEDKKALARITRAAETAKITLSDQPYVQINEEYLLEHQGEAVHLSMELSRDTYEAMIEDYINETLDAVHVALQGANFTAADIDEILLVGGATRTPCIRERLFDEFGFEPHGEIDPDLCVAWGAATQAAMIAGEEVTSVLVDVTPYTYGTSAVAMLDGEQYPFVFFPVIRKNTTLPVSKTEAFQTMHDGQQTVEVTVYQGEHIDALENIEIGKFTVKGLKDVPAGNVITLTLSLDLNGILQVSAKEKATGLEKSIVIENALSAMQGEALESAKQRVGKLFGQNDKLFTDTGAEQASDQVREYDEARGLIAKAEALFDQVSEEDKEDMAALVEQIRKALEQHNDAALEEPVEHLQEILYYLES